MSDNILITEIALAADDGQDTDYHMVKIEVDYYLNEIGGIEFNSIKPVVDGTMQVFTDISAWLPQDVHEDIACQIADQDLNNRYDYEGV